MSWKVAACAVCDTLHNPPQGIHVSDNTYVECLVQFILIFTWMFLLLLAPLCSCMRILITFPRAFIAVWF